ncbi:hypothetical protein IAU59_003872 [Kwoniella sp. CBS 9459]
MSEHHHSHYTRRPSSSSGRGAGSVSLSPTARINVPVNGNGHGNSLGRVSEASAAALTGRRSSCVRPIYTDDYSSLLPPNALAR